MTELVGRFGLDPQQLRQLVKQAAAEKAAGKPAKNGRALFRLLRQSFEREQAGD
jgi:ribosome-associated protein